MGLTRGQKGRARNVPGNDLADFGRERAQAEEAAAGRRVCGWAGMVSVIVYSRSFGDAVIDHISMGEAVDRFVAMAEGNRRRRHDEAQHRECCEYGRELKAKPGRERDQHGFRVVFTPCIHQNTGWEQIAQARPPIQYEPMKGIHQLACRQATRPAAKKPCGSR